MNIKLRLAEEGESGEGAARGPTLEFVLERGEMLLEEEEVEDELKGERQSQQQQVCTKASENDSTQPRSAAVDSSEPPTLTPDNC